MVLTVATIKGSLGAQGSHVFLKTMALHFIPTLVGTVLLHILALGHMTLQLSKWPYPLAAILLLTASHLQLEDHIAFKVLVVHSRRCVFPAQRTNVPFGADIGQTLLAEVLTTAFHNEGLDG